MAENDPIMEKLEQQATEMEVKEDELDKKMKAIDLLIKGDWVGFERAGKHYDLEQEHHGT